MPFLPTTKKEMEQRGIHQMDFVYVIGDAYVDHSSFGTGDHQPRAGSPWLHGGNPGTAGLEE